MLPQTLEQESSIIDFEVTEERDLPSKTYYMDLERERVKGWVTDKNSMKQAIFKILNTERYQYPKIYSDNYGVELWNLYGKSKIYCVPEIERRIREALTWDERIESVTDFTFDTAKNNIIAVSFTANTIFGAVEITDFEVSI